MLRNEADSLRKVVVCSPRAAYFDVADLEAHNMRAHPDRERAQRQHRALCETLAAFGAVIIDAPELPGHPNSVFTQDVGLATPEGWIQLRMGLPSRCGEPEWMTEVLAQQGIPLAGAISAPGAVEGGDVILAGDVAFVGHSARTNAEGVRQIRVLLERMGFEVRVIPVPPPSLHIGGMVSVIGPRQVLACTDVLSEHHFRGFEIIPITKRDFISGNVITLGRPLSDLRRASTSSLSQEPALSLSQEPALSLSKGEVIAECSNGVVNAVLEAAGFTVHALDLSEFVKGGGGPSCLILPLEREVGAWGGERVEETATL